MKLNNGYQILHINLLTNYKNIVKISAEFKSVNTQVLLISTI